jgi:hypothetical protein
MNFSEDHIMKKILGIAASMMFAAGTMCLAQQSTAPQPSTQDPTATQPSAAPATPATNDAQQAPTSQQTAPAPGDAQATPTSADAKPFSGMIVKEKGKLVLKDSVSNSSYKLDDQDKAKQFEGKQVNVNGKLDSSTNQIRVDSIVAAN